MEDNVGRAGLIRGEVIDAGRAEASVVTPALAASARECRRQESQRRLYIDDLNKTLLPVRKSASETSESKKKVF